MKLCLGTVQFGMNYGIQGNGRPQEENVFKILSFAINHGVEMLDTAAAYGEAEAVLGNYIRKYPEMGKKIRITSKLTSNAFLNEDINVWSATAVQNAHESLNRIGIDKLFAYLFHNASNIYNEKAVEALYAVKEAGIAERIGVSIYTPEEAMKALEYPVIGVIQIPYNIFDHRLDRCGFFERAKAQNVKVFARSSLLQGLLMMNPNNLPERVGFAKGYLEKFRDICSQFGISTLNAAIGYVGSKSVIDYVVFGVDNIVQLQEYIEMKDIILPEELIKSIDQAFETVEDRLVNPTLWR